MKQNELHTIVTACLEGNSQAQTQLYRLFASKMYGVCLRYARDTTEAEDILQDGFIKVFQYLANFKNEGSLEGWIRRIMINTALERFRKKNPMYLVSEIHEYDCFLKTEDIESAISAQELLQLVQKLSPGYKMVFNLFAIEGYSHKEIAAQLGISEGTSKSQLARARAVLQGEVVKLHKRALKRNEAI